MQLDLEYPLRLAVGSHEAGSGRGCAMNALSWMMGDQEISDFPDCSAGPLARMVQGVNDLLGRENGTTRVVSGDPQADVVETATFLNVEDSLTVLDLAWSTVGTAGADQFTTAIWAKRVIQKAWFVYQESASDSMDVQDMLRQAMFAAFSDNLLGFAAAITQAVYDTVGGFGMTVFVADAIALWRELMEMDAPAEVDQAAVAEAIDKMVSV